MDEIEVLSEDERTPVFWLYREVDDDGDVSVRLVDITGDYMLMYSDVLPSLIEALQRAQDEWFTWEVSE